MELGTYYTYYVLIPTYPFPDIQDCVQRRARIRNPNDLTLVRNRSMPIRFFLFMRSDEYQNIKRTWINALGSDSFLFLTIVFQNLFLFKWFQKTCGQNSFPFWIRLALLLWCSGHFRELRIMLEWVNRESLRGILCTSKIIAPFLQLAIAK